MQNIPLEVRDKMSEKALATVRRRHAAEGILVGEMRCSLCSKVKPETEFTATGRNRKGVRKFKYCKPCAGKISRIEKLRNVFHMTEHDYDLLHLVQEGLCAICGKKPEEGQNRLSVDHRHKDGLIRGLLCWLCNRVLGILRDNPERAERVAQYLRKPPAIAVLGERFAATGRVTASRKPRKDPYLVRKKPKSGKPHGESISEGKFLKTVAWG